MSQLYGGKQSDKAIVRHSGLLQKLEDGDVVMADRGFEISSDLPPGVGVITPAFMEGRPQLPAREEKLSRKIAAHRIHVEHAIRRVKTFRILSHVFLLRMKPCLEFIWQICARLTNFMPPLIAGDTLAAEHHTIPVANIPDLPVIDDTFADELSLPVSPSAPDCVSASTSPGSCLQPSPSDPGYVPSPPTSPIALTQPPPSPSPSPGAREPVPGCFQSMACLWLIPLCNAASSSAVLFPIQH